MKNPLKMKLILVLVAVISVTATAGAVTYAVAQRQAGVPATAGPIESVVPISGRSALRGYAWASGDDLNQSTSSTVHVGVPDMIANFNTLRRGDALITFSGMTWAPDDALMYVTAQIDGVEAHGGEVQFTGDSDEDDDGRWARAHTWQWIFPDLGVGNHTVEILFRSWDGQPVIIHKRSVSVLHR